MNSSEKAYFEELHGRLWRNNHRPSKADELGIKSLVKTAEKNISVIDEEINSIRKRLLQLTYTSRQIKVNADICKSFLAPIRLLPSDVLLEIFAYIDASPTTVALCQVSSSWRNAILQHPIQHLRNLGPSPDFIHTEIDFAEEGIVLNIRSLHAPIKSFLQGITPLYRSLSTLSITSPWSNNILQLPEGNIPLLKTFILAQGQKRSGTIDVKPRIFDLGAPNLRKLMIDLPSPHVIHSTFFTSIPWRHLTHAIFQLNNSHFNISDVFEGAPDLELAAFDLDVFHFREVKQLANPNPRVSKLKLHLTACYNESFKRWFSLLQFPALTMLDVVLDHAIPISLLSQVMSPSLSTLCFLSLGYIPTTAQELSAMLSRCTSLEELALIVDDKLMDGTTVFEVLHTISIPNRPMSQTAKLSNLTALHLTFEDKFTNDVLREQAIAATNLLHVWMEIPIRRHALQTVSLIICSNISELHFVQETMSIAMERLKPWTRTANGSSGFELRLDVCRGFPKTFTPSTQWCHL